jgi:PAS domain S-box-containing protein
VKNDDSIEDCTPLSQTVAGQGAWAIGVVEEAVDAIVTIDKHGMIEYVNPAVLRMFGYAREELIGQNVRILMPEPHQSAHDGYIRRHLETGEKKIIGIGRDTEGQCKDGSTFPLHLSVSKVQVGDRLIFTGILRDISGQKQGEQEQARLLYELKERNKKLACLYRVGEIIRTSAVEQGMVKQVAGVIRPACHQPDITGVRVRFDDIEVKDGIAEGDAVQTSTAEIRAGGRARGNIMLEYRRALSDPEEAEDQNLIEAIAHTLGESLDRRHAELQVVQASKLASIGELAAGVGHEINNPVNGIINCADLLIQRMEGGSPHRQFAELIRSEADRIALIVRNLLAFSRQQREGHSLARIYDVVQAVLSLSGKKIKHSHIQLSVEVPENLPRVKCRSEQMQQVVMNLILNAIYALDERYPEADPGKILRITGREIRLDEKRFLRLSILDQGMGISPTNKDRLFDPFFTTKGRDVGTGLGLSVSLGIMKDHGGNISAESEPGKYTRFDVDLPLEENENA